ncbi:MAG: hypothetical protein D6780_07600 [Candidatus Dadabacteria bacterium]|nr:MAG: hypothetical protein D6780_07600 [Candidatus Dadabacteria bacterium]
MSIYTNSQEIRKRLIYLVVLLDSKATNLFVKYPLFPFQDKVENCKGLCKIEKFFNFLLDRGVKNVVLYLVPEQKLKQERGYFSKIKKLTEKLGLSIKRIKQLGDFNLVVDLCLCQLLNHGHCGVISNGDIDEEETVKILVWQGLFLADAGADILMPSSMCKELVPILQEEVRKRELNALIFSQQVKFYSSTYGAFRSVALYPSFRINKESYQVNPLDSQYIYKYILEAKSWQIDGIVIKPSWAYADILKAAKERWQGKVIAFLTSGEHLILEESFRGQNRKVSREVFLTYLLHSADMAVSYWII